MTSTNQSQPDAKFVMEKEKEKEKEKEQLQFKSGITNVLIWISNDPRISAFNLFLTLCVTDT